MYLSAEYSTSICEAWGRVWGRFLSACGSFTKGHCLRHVPGSLGPYFTFLDESKEPRLSLLLRSSALAFFMCVGLRMLVKTFPAEPSRFSLTVPAKTH